jgi:hypothetical protein
MARPVKIDPELKQKLEPFYVQHGENKIEIKEVVLEKSEVHPAIVFAAEFLRKNLTADVVNLIAERAVTEGDDKKVYKLALSTITRMQKQMQVSDKYIMGLALTIYDVLYKLQEELPKND